jgi:hypothetical protein
MVAIKVFFLSDCRRAKHAPGDLEAFRRYLFEVTGSRQVSIRYKDDEGDLVSIATNDEYLDFLNSCEKLATFYIDLPVNLTSSRLISNEKSLVLPFKSNDESSCLESSKVLLSDLNIQDFEESSEKNSDPVLLESIRNLVKEEMKKKKEKKSIVQHFGVTCAGCRSSPIIGIRYKCSECPVEFCEDCEESLNHEHPFFKIRSSQDFEGSEKVRTEKVEHDSKALRFIREKVIAQAEPKEEVGVNLKKLCEMGFSKDIAVQALSYSKNNFQSALNLLLAQHK